MAICSPDHRFTRRQLLKGAATISAFTALARRGDAEVQTVAVNPRDTAKSCIYINLNGAPSQLDTFDPKDGPWNPPDVDLRQYPGGIVLSNKLFPELSKITNRLCVLRSLNSWEAVHERGQFYLQTAHPANPAFLAESPHIGSVIGVERGITGPLPPFLQLNASTGPGAKFLGGKYEPLYPPSNAGGLTSLEHNYYGTASKARFEEKFRLLQDMDAKLRDAPPGKVMADHSEFYDAARRMMYDQAVASVFQFTDAEAGRYGNTAVGRSCLVARNAVRAKNGTYFVSIAHGSWDMHQNMFDKAYSPNMYTMANDLDRAVGALVEDLRVSGDLDSTLILLMGEFGRTPGTLNIQGGRDHHKNAMSALLIGGGVRGGRAIGATDPEGDHVVTPGWKGDRPIVMEDIAATMYSALGVNWTKSLTDTPSGRRFEYVPFGAQGTYTAIDEVFG